MKQVSLCLLIALLVLSVSGQKPAPIIDVHLHASDANAQGPPPLAMCTPVDPFPVWDNRKPYGETIMKAFKKPKCKNPVWSPMTDEEIMVQTVEIMNRRNIYGILSGTPEMVATWKKAAPGRFYSGLQFQIGREKYTSADMRAMHKDGRLEVLAEVTNQYAGIAPNDKRMEPYWKLAEELDIPVGIHIGPGPPGVIYLGASKYRARLHSALTLEEVLVRHPRLRVYIMHAGYPLLDDLLALMYSHPQVYVEVGVIVFTQPRPAFYRYLKGIMDSGFGNRVMFGSDQMVWPGVIERSVKVIEEAPFLSERQRRDIFYNNAARFLRLSEKEIARHHGT